MSANAVRFVLALAMLLTLAPSRGWAGAKSHIAVPPAQILNLRGGAPNNGQASALKLDVNGPPFVVPPGYVFVATDVQIQSNSLDPSHVFLVFVNFDNAQQRYLYAPFQGIGYAESFTSGFVAPAGATPTIVNMAGSDFSVIVGVQGYLLKATALPVNTAP